MCPFGLQAFQRVRRLAMSGLHFAIPIIFPKYDFSMKNYLILYAKQNKSGSESSVSCLKQGSEMSNFCLTQGRGLKVSLSSQKTFCSALLRSEIKQIKNSKMKHTSTQTSLECPPAGPTP